MSLEMSQAPKTSSELDKEYHDTVLKVPDCFGVVKGGITKHKLLTGRDLFCVSNLIFFFHLL